MKEEIYNRYKNYNKSHCWQYDIRLKNLQQDLIEASLTQEKVANLKCCDFDFSFIPVDHKEQCYNIKKFIEKQEWLSNIPNRPTHRFISQFNGKLAGAIILAVPNNFSNILGK